MTQKRELPTQPPSSLKIQSQGATHDEMYCEFMRIWEEERRRQKEEKEFMHDWNAELQRRKDAAKASAQKDLLRAQRWNKKQRDRLKEENEQRKLSEIPLWIFKDGTGECKVVREDQVPDEDRKRVHRVDPYAAERPRWEREWEAKQEEEERLREEAEKELDEHDLWWNEMQTRVNIMMQNTLDWGSEEVKYGHDDSDNGSIDGHDDDGGDLSEGDHDDSHDGSTNGHDDDEGDRSGSDDAQSVGAHGPEDGESGAEELTSGDETVPVQA